MCDAVCLQMKAVAIGLSAIQSPISSSRSSAEMLILNASTPHALRGMPANSAGRADSGSYRITDVFTPMIQPELRSELIYYFLGRSQH